jgi:hypothetical protein
MTIFGSFLAQPFNSIPLRLQGGPYYFMLYHVSRGIYCLTRLVGEDSSHRDVETRKGSLWSRTMLSTAPRQAREEATPLLRARQKLVLIEEMLSANYS